jgi:DNA modification methylase
MTQEAPGQVHLENGDSREIDSLWTAMAGKRKPTAIITSPPYGNLKDYGSPGQIGFGQSYSEYLDDMDAVFRGLAQVSSDKTTLWLIVDTFRENDPATSVWTLRQIPSDLSALAQQHGWIARDVIIWEKDRTLPWSGAGRLRNSFEYVLMFVRGPGFTYNAGQVRTPVRKDGWWERWPERHHPSGSVPTNVWSIPIPIQGSWRTDADHACPLPPELARRLVILSSSPGDAVLDPFAGTGTVLAVAADLRRDAFGVDLSRESVQQFEVNRDNVRNAGERVDTSNHIPPEDVIQARRIKFASRLLALLAPAGFHPILADVSDDRAATEIRADLNLTLVFEPNQLRPTKQELFSYWEKAPLSKFGLDVKPTMISTSTWLQRRSGSTLYEPTGRGFWRMRPVTDLVETRRRALAQPKAFVVCVDPPAAYLAEQ